jgi:hypothetical protein
MNIALETNEEKVNLGNVYSDTFSRMLFQNLNTIKLGSYSSKYQEKSLFLPLLHLLLCFNFGTTILLIKRVLPKTTIALGIDFVSSQSKRWIFIKH